MQEKSNMERRDVYYAGRVQGVGFRYTAARIAAGLDVGGFVCNLPDGRVHLAAEGRPGEIDRLLCAVEDAMGANIRNVQVDRKKPTGAFREFTIRP